MSDSDKEKEVMSTWDKSEEENEAAMRERALQAELEEDMNPKRPWLLRFFNLVSFITGGSAVNMALGQFIGIAFHAVGPIEYVLRVYVILLCVLVILNELGWTSLTRDSALLRWWITRGAIYAFIGVLGLEENNVEKVTVEESGAGRKAALNYIMVVAWLMIGCGVLYFVMGALCIQLVYNRMRDDYKNRKERAKEVRRTTEKYMRKPPAPV